MRPDNVGEGRPIGSSASAYRDHAKRDGSVAVERQRSIVVQSEKLGSRLIRLWVGMSAVGGRTDSTRRGFWAVREPILTFEPFAEGLSSAVFCADGGDLQIVVLATTGRPNFKNNSNHRQSFELEVVNVTPIWKCKLFY